MGPTSLFTSDLAGLAPSLSWAALGLSLAVLLAVTAAVTAWSWPRRRTWDEWVDFRNRRRGARPAPVGTTARLLRLPRAAVATFLRRVLPVEVFTMLAAQLRCAARDGGPDEVIADWMLMTVVAGVIVSLLALVGAIPIPLVVPLVIIPVFLGWARLVRAGARRRTAIAVQLPILVDLMALEQSGGGVGSRRAMELVVSRVGGEAAAVLRTCLAGSATTGTEPLDLQLEIASRDLQIASLASLAAVVRLQRQEGIATAAPLGRLARGLRDRQRDDLTARGRRALITMLLPIATCILLPFVLIILYPALQRLSGALS
ncbi:MAG: type II secretion system F family protein [Candidatus Dormibacteria bacterium]